MSDEAQVEQQVENHVEHVSKSIVNKEAAERIRLRPAGHVRQLIDAFAKEGKKVNVDRLFEIAELNNLVLTKFNRDDAGKTGFIGRLSMTVSAMLQARYEKGETVHGGYDEHGNLVSITKEQG